MISWSYQVSDLISRDIRTVLAASDWLIVNLAMEMACNRQHNESKIIPSKHAQHIPLCLLHASCVSRIPTRLHLSPQQHQNPGRKRSIQRTVKYKNHLWALLFPLATVLIIFSCSSNPSLTIAHQTFAPLSFAENR